MYQARSLPDNPQGWAVFAAFLIIYVALQAVLPEKFKSGWRSWTVNAVLMIAAVAALFAVHA
ncbi:hypothetical protein AERO_01440 [Aeromicrobium fastidiosum]|uniref:hypothetical protein n=1 Tax=Aeromicrobium fastidiosum TaxID=52699 RepID=UPI0020234E5E|nr:hypothetical protein [Aeromicrobium fastidiosum]MCL8250033.1 hypothetical protein [Aeromicrobium fastidiosum]